MFRSRYLKFLALLATVSTGTTFQFSTGCNQFYYDSALTSFNFCSVLNCTGGTFFNFCEPTILLSDCPNLTTGTP